MAASDVIIRIIAQNDGAEQVFRRTGQAALGMGLALAAGVAATVKSAAEFDKQMSAVAAATGATGKELDSLRDAALKAGASTAFSAMEAAQGIEELSKAGLKSSEIIGGGLAGALDLAAAGGIEVADAAETIATTLAAFQLSGRRATDVADALAAGASEAAGGVGDLP